MTPPITRIVAHRGAWSAHLPQNSLAAFEEAIRLGVPWVELDVRRTADDQLVCVHDPLVGDAPVGALTLAALRERDPHVARLEEVLELARTRLQIDVELKETGYEGRVARLAQAMLGRDGFVFTSFYDAAVAAVKAHDPAIRAGLLLGRPKPRPYVRTRLSEVFPERRLRACGADLVAPNWQLLRARFLWRMRKLGLPVWTWTVNDPARIARLAAAGVEAVITDEPPVAMGLVGGGG